MKLPSRRAVLLLVASASSAAPQCGPSGTNPYPPGSTTCPGSSGSGSDSGSTSTCAEGAVCIKTR
eukprot:630731-Prymnesium_polylepis.1